MRAQIPAVKEPVSLMRDDNKRPDGATLLPWAGGKPVAWDVTVPDTYAESHTDRRATKPSAAASNKAQNKIDKYAKLTSTHIFYPGPMAIDTAGTWHDMATELNARDLQAHHRHHRGQLWTMFVHSSSKRESGLLPQYHCHRIRRRCNQLHFAYTLCLKVSLLCFAINLTYTNRF